MKGPCQHVREKWEAYKKGISLAPQEIKEIADHLHTCSECSEFAYGESLSSLLKGSYGGDSPEPSEFFFTSIERKLRDVDQQNRKITFSEVLLQRGWKLAPVMTALVIFLTASLAYQYNSVSKMETPTSIEDIIFSEDTPLNVNDVLTAIISEKMNNGK